MQVLENICLMDADLLPMLQKVKHFFILLKEDDEKRTATMKFNTNFTLGFGEDRSNGKKYLLINSCAFYINKKPSYKYFEEVKEMAEFFNVNESEAGKFNNKVLIPWVCEVLQIHFEIDPANLTLFLL